MVQTTIVKRNSSEFSGRYLVGVETDSITRGADTIPSGWTIIKDVV